MAGWLGNVPSADELPNRWRTTDQCLSDAASAQGALERISATVFECAEQAIKTQLPGAAVGFFERQTGVVLNQRLCREIPIEAFRLSSQHGFAQDR